MSSTFKTTRWRKFGKDRLYVNTDDGQRVGWHDLQTGVSVVELEVHSHDFHDVVARWRAENEALLGGPAVSTAPAGDAGPLPDDVQVGASTGGEGVDDVEAEVVVVPDAVVPEEVGPAPNLSDAGDSAPVPWSDLSQRFAGAAAREEALRLRQAAPVRTALARVLRMHTDERAWRIGADGEEMVAAQLARLVKRDRRWCYLHAIPVGRKGSDIDHLVIGPGGVYTLNSKHHPGCNLWIGGSSFLVNGHRTNYIRNSRFEADRAGKLLTAACGLPVRAVGVIVPVNAKSITVKSSPADVKVVNRMALVKWLGSLGPILDEDAIRVIFESARRSVTWQT